MSGLIEAVELRDAATDVKETETETGDEEEKRVSKTASAMSRGGTIRLAAAGLAMSLQCAMFDAWAMSCLTGRSSSPRGTGVEIDVELPKTVVAALLAVIDLLRAGRMTKEILLGARRAEGRCRATATTRRCRAARRGAPRSVHMAEPGTLGPGLCRWPVASSLLLNALVEAKRTPT